MVIRSLCNFLLRIYVHIMSINILFLYFSRLVYELIFLHFLIQLYKKIIIIIDCGLLFRNSMWFWIWIQLSFFFILFIIEKVIVVFLVEYWNYALLNLFTALIYLLFQQITAFSIIVDDLVLHNICEIFQFSDFQICDVLQFAINPIN